MFFTRERRIDWIGAAFVFVVTQIVYISTLTIEVPFWDSGEFIATSYILGIPHPPGTPLYILIGRVFSLLPVFELVATRVNYLSAFASGMVAVFTYLITTEVYRYWFRRPNDTSDEWAVTSAGGGARAAEGRLARSAAGDGEVPGASAAGGPDAMGGQARGPSAVVGVAAGLVAAGFCAFGRTFWDNAIEAEVYALSSLIMTLSVWLILRWARPEGDRSRRTGIFLLLYYLICLSMGIHLGTFLVLPGIILFAYVVDRRIFGDSPIAAAFLAGIMILLHPGMLPTLKLGVWVPLLFLVVLLVVLGAGRWGAAGTRGILSWCAIAAVLGISTHMYLKIRAGLDPAINEADPETWSALWKMLIRDQYKPPNPFTDRQAGWAIQFTKHFWDYARDQYQVAGLPGALGLFLPYAIGLIGAIGHFLREKKTFLLLVVIYLITSIGLVFYLNFRENEVRPRDYFFVASFHFFAIWIGLGVAYLLEEIRTFLPRAGALPRSVLAVVGALFVLLPTGTLAHYWFSHDRTDFHVARDFAHNILAPLEPNAILFTNGDNDTFPLWYLQEVEGVRRDVRVVNLSLLNTAWYMRQLRDMEPAVNLEWSDEQIGEVERFSGYMAAYHAGMIDRRRLEQFLDAYDLAPYVRTLDLQLMAKDVSVARIVDQEYGIKPIYIALTVPDLMGLEPRLVQKGIVYQVEEPKGTEPRVDIDATTRLLTDVYRYRGLLVDGGRDTTVYKDENASKLVQNYAAAALAGAQQLLRRDRVEQAHELARFAEAIAPDATAVQYSLGILESEMGRPEAAEARFQKLVATGRGDPIIYGLLAQMQEMQGKLGEAAETYRRSIAAHPDDWETYRALFSLLWRETDEPMAAIEVLDLWLRRHPDDLNVQRARDVWADSARIRMEQDAS